MIKFDIEKLRVEHVKLKACTTALGGSISVVDVERSVGDKEVYKKIPVPLAVARAFIKLHEISRYLKPVLTAVAYYEDHVVALERHPMGNAGKEETEGLFGRTKWKSKMEFNATGLLKTLTSNGDWYVDGSFVFQPEQAHMGDFLSQDGRFRAVNAQAIKLANLPKDEDLVPTDRTCLAYFALNGQSAMTCPIWKDLGKVGNRQLDRVASDQDLEADDVGITTDDYQFDRVDEHLAVNLAFALKAGKEVSEVFGYESIEPLQLDELMIQLRTVNLPKVAGSIKQTFDIGIPFTHAIAWLIGMNNRVQTLDSYMVLRSLLKYLTTKGTYRKGAFETKSVYKRGVDEDDIPMKTKEDALRDAATVPGQIYIPTRSTSTPTGTTAGRLYGAE